MQVIHVRTDGASTERDSAFIEMVVSGIDGVRDVATVPSMGLVSVLYDDRRSEPTDIIEAVCSAGFRARNWYPRDVASRTPLAA
jgi:copper chaperone CopZ